MCRDEPLTNLDAVGGAVEEADAADAVEDGVAAVLQHVVGADGRLALPLGGEDGTLHDGEILLVQHLGHVWQLSTDGRRFGLESKETEIF